MKPTMLPDILKRLQSLRRTVHVAPAVLIAGLLLAASVSPLVTPRLASASLDPTLDASLHHDAEGTTLAVDADAGDGEPGAAVDTHRDGDALDADASAHAAGRDGGASASSSGRDGDHAREPERSAWGLRVEPDHQGVYAGESAEYEITLFNPTNASLTIRLDARNVTRGWKASLEEDSVNVSANDSARVNLTLFAPDEGTPGERGTVYLAAYRADAHDDRRRASASATIVTPPPHGGAEATLSPDVREGAPGEVVNFTLEVTHTGNTRERYMLSASADGRPTRVHPDYLDLAPGETGRALVMVYVPENATEGTTFTVHAGARGTSPWGATAKADAEVRVTAPPTEYGVKLAFTPHAQNVRAGESVEYALIVENTGNVDETIGLRLGPLPRGWHAELATDTVALAPGETRNVSVTVHAPYSGEPGDAARITAFAVIQEGPRTMHTGHADAAASAMARIHAGPWYAVDVDARAIDDEAQPGENLTFIAGITNTGDRADTFHVSVTNDRGFPTNVSQLRVQLAPGERAFVPFTAHVPRDAEPESAVRFTVKATAASDTRATDADDVEGRVIAPPYDYGVTGGFTNGNTRYAEPGETVNFTLRLKNGNGTHGFLVTLDDLPRDWSYDANPDAFVLAPGAEREIVIHVTVSECEDLSERQFDVVAHATREVGHSTYAEPEEVLRLEARVQVVHPGGVVGAATSCAA